MRNEKNKQNGSGIWNLKSTHILIQNFSELSNRQDSNSDWFRENLTAKTGNEQICKFQKKLNLPSLFNWWLIRRIRSAWFLLSQIVCSKKLPYPKDTILVQSFGRVTLAIHYWPNQHRLVRKWLTQLQFQAIYPVFPGNNLSSRFLENNFSAKENSEEI